MTKPRIITCFYCRERMVDTLKESHRALSIIVATGVESVRCLTESEMLARGWKRENGVWVEPQK